MPNNSVLDSWTVEEIAAFDKQIENQRFKNIRGLVTWAAERGLKISRGAAHSRKNVVQRRVELVKASAQAMEQIADSIKDDTGKASSAILALMHSEVFEVMLNVQQADEEEDPAKRLKLLKEAALIVQRLTNSNIRLKNFQVEANARLAAELEVMKQSGEFDGKTLDAVQKRVAVYLPDNGRN
jgi:hypothetical protein